MGSCIGRCSCEVGKCCCCDCVFLKRGFRDQLTRKHMPSKSQTFALRRQSSSTTIEFENLMFEFDLPDNPNSMIQMHPTSVSSWLALKDSQIKEKEENKLALRCRDSDVNYKIKRFRFHNELSCGEDNRNNINDNLVLPIERELPIIDSLLLRLESQKTKIDSLDSKERVSLGGSSSVGDLQWENEIIFDEFGANEQNGNEANEGNEGNELEWDHYEEDSMAFHHQTEQLIDQIEHLTQSTHSTQIR